MTAGQEGGGESPVHTDGNANANKSCGVYQWYGVSGRWKIGGDARRASVARCTTLGIVWGRALGLIVPALAGPVDKGCTSHDVK